MKVFRGRKKSTNLKPPVAGAQSAETKAALQEATTEE
jgi:hypothetical protein